MDQTEKAFQKQDAVFIGAKRLLGKKTKRAARYWRQVGLGFQTPKEAKEGKYVDKKCPFTGNVSIRGRVLKGMCISTKMKRTIVIRRNYLHYIKKYNRFEKRHHNVSVHCSPCFDVKEGDICTVGECRPLAKTVASTTLNSEVAREREQLALEREDAFSSLADLHEQHCLAKASFREREAALDGQVREQEEDIARLKEELRELEGFRDRVKYADRNLKPLEQKIQELQVAFRAEQSLRKWYHNQLQDAKGAIRVFVRIRPKVDREQDDRVAVRKVDTFSLHVEPPSDMQPREAKPFMFDAVFDEHSTQEDVFAECKGLVSSAIDGFNVTVFAYGQTGAGKTHTMYGNEAAPGLVPRVAEEIFAVLGNYAHECRAQVRCSMFEFYRNNLVDLFVRTEKGKALPPLNVKNAHGSVYVENSATREAAGPADLLSAIFDGLARRHVAATKMNADSSRSHVIVVIVIESTSKTTKQVSTGKLTLCDLAGSEQVKKSGVTGEQMKEALSINQSLSALGNVIEALTKHENFVPYRNNQLTKFLRDSVGGNAKTLMLVHCSPVAGSAEETAAALGYAARAKLIVNKVEKNQDSDEIHRLKQENLKMTQQLEQARAAAGSPSLPRPGDEESEGDE